MARVVRLNCERTTCIDPTVILHTIIFTFCLSLFQLRHVCHDLVHVNAKLPKIDLGQLNLLHQLLVRCGNIVESEDAPAKTEEEERAEGNEGPEWELLVQKSS